ncbi:MAG TPA: tetratricopeptide repeat protein, partial [Thermoanaerobaculia bacterium]|nr:tetratricopeptide repeat protein [Thermoanaerobaculia bacterium]
MTKREQVVKVAEKYVAKGRIDSAIKEYLKVLKENPNDVSTLNRLGDLYARISRIDEAVRLFAQIAAQYTEDGFLVKAIAIYKKIIKLDPTRLEVYESLAELYHKQGLVNEARTQYQVLGDYYLKHHDNAAAINIFLRMVELEPDNPSHHLKLAELYQQGQLWDKALRSYRTIAELMLQHGRVEEAVRVYQRAIEVYPEDLGFITDAVLGIKDAGHTGAAAKLLASAVAANPQAEKVARLAGLRSPGDTTEAMPAASRPRPTGDARETLPPPRAAAPVAPPPRPSEPPPPWASPHQEEREESEDDFFVLDIDEPSGSVVMPPADMDAPGTAFQRPAERRPPPPEPRQESPAEASGAEAPEAAGGEAEGWTPGVRDSGFEFEMPDLELPDLEMEEAGALETGEAAPAEEMLETLEPLEETRLPWEEPGALQGEAESIEDSLEESVELELDLSELAVEPEPGEVPGLLDEIAEAPQDIAAFDADAGFELELEEPEAGWAEAEPPPAPGVATPLAAPPPPQVPEPPPPPPPVEEPRLQDLLAEAEVFAKYNLEEKALERLDQVLHREPHHLDALQLLVDLQIRGGDAGRVESAVRRLRHVVEERRASDVWERVLAKLARAGMTLAGETVAPIRSAQEDRVSQLIKSLEQPA